MHENGPLSGRSCCPESETSQLRVSSLLSYFVQQSIQLGRGEIVCIPYPKLHGRGYLYKRLFPTAAAA